MIVIEVCKNCGTTPSEYASSSVCAHETERFELDDLEHGLFYHHIAKGMYSEIKEPLENFRAMDVLRRSWYISTARKHVVQYYLEEWQTIKRFATFDKALQVLVAKHLQDHLSTRYDLALVFDGTFKFNIDKRAKKITLELGTVYSCDPLVYKV